MGIRDFVESNRDRQGPGTGWGSSDGGGGRAFSSRYGGYHDPSGKTKARVAPKTPAAVKPRPKPQPAVAPDRSLLDKLLRERARAGGPGRRATVLTELYGLPEDPKVASRALQAFNSRLGGRTVLGRLGA